MKMPQTMTRITARCEVVHIGEVQKSAKPQAARTGHLVTPSPFHLVTLSSSRATNETSPATVEDAKKRAWVARDHPSFHRMALKDSYPPDFPRQCFRQTAC